MRKWIWRIGIGIGLLELCGALFWCQGIYGSPFAQMRRDEVVKVIACLLVGPLSVLPAAILARSHPRWSALWLLLGGIVAGYLILFSIPQPNEGYDFETVAPLLLVSLPMLVLGTLHMLTARAPRVE